MNIHVKESVGCNNGDPFIAFSLRSSGPHREFKIQGTLLAEGANRLPAKM